MKFLNIMLIIVLTFLISCMRYLTDNRDEVILEGIDLDQTIRIATLEMEHKNGSFGTSLPIWIIRDQYFNTSQAKIVKELYLKHINTLEKKFDLWHLTWAISNIHRLGSDSVKLILDEIIEDVRIRAKNAGKISTKMSDPNERLYLGDAHGGGRGYAKRHIVVPGNKKYLQSFNEYLKKKEKNDEK